MVSITRAKSQAISDMTLRNTCAEDNSSPVPEDSQQTICEFEVNSTVLSQNSTIILNNSIPTPSNTVDPIVIVNVANLRSTFPSDTNSSTCDLESLSQTSMLSSTPRLEAEVNLSQLKAHSQANPRTNSTNLQQQQLVGIDQEEGIITSFCDTSEFEATQLHLQTKGLPADLQLRLDQVTSEQETTQGEGAAAPTTDVEGLFHVDVAEHRAAADGYKTPAPERNLDIADSARAGNIPTILSHTKAHTQTEAQDQTPISDKTTSTAETNSDMIIPIGPRNRHDGSGISACSPGAPVTGTGILSSPNARATRLPVIDHYSYLHNNSQFSFSTGQGGEDNNFLNHSCTFQALNFARAAPLHIWNIRSSNTKASECVDGILHRATMHYVIACDSTRDPKYIQMPIGSYWSAKEALFALQRFNGNQFANMTLKDMTNEVKGKTVASAIETLLLYHSTDSDYNDRIFIVVTQGYTTTVGITGGLFFHFDSHSRDSEGQVTPVGSKASGAFTMISHSLTNIIQIYRKLYESGAQGTNHAFDIYSVDFVPLE